MIDERDDEVDYYDEEIDVDSVDNVEIIDDTDNYCLEGSSKPKVNFLPRDRLRYTPNIGVLRVKTRLLKDPMKTSKHKEWINNYVKSIEMIKVSDVIDDKNALCTLGQALYEIDPKKFDPAIYDFAGIEMDEKENSIDIDIPQTVEQLFLKYQTINSEIINRYGACMILPPVIYIADEYNVPMSKVYPNDTELVGKIIPNVVVKLMVTVNGMTLEVYRFSTDTLFDIMTTKSENNEDISLVVPTKCKSVTDLVSYETYKLLKGVKNYV